MTAEGQKLEGRKLLMLGSNAASEYIVRYAQSQGAFVYAADYLPDHASPAKGLADKSVLVSTADTDALEALVRQEKIDGVFAGISEFNLIQAMKVSERCNLPFYCSSSQWDQVERKDNFRRMCVQHGVPCPKTLFCGAPEEMPWESIEYPIVLKPVDSGASIGVHICASEVELRNNLDDALSASASGRVIVEQRCFGEEFTAHYTVYHGMATLACIDNRYPVAVHEGAVTTIPAARVYPGTCIDSYLQQVNPSMIALIESLGLSNAVLFVQGLYDSKSGTFAIFEAGLRSAAEVPFRFIERVNGINYMNMLIDQVLTGQCDDYAQEKEDPFLGGHTCAVVSLVARQGKVAEIRGFQEAKAECIQVFEEELRYPIGSIIPDSDSLRQIALRYVMDCENRDQVISNTLKLYRMIDIIDTEGKSLVVNFDPEVIRAVRD